MKSRKDVTELVLSGGYEADYISLSKLLGVEIKDVVGRVSPEFDEPVFDIRRILLADGRVLSCSGEHDIAYLEPNEDVISQEQLELLLD